MKTFLLYTLSIVLVACNRQQTERPIWLNPSASITIDSLDLRFESRHHDWQAFAISFRQPIALQLFNTEHGFTIKNAVNKNIIAGPAQICLVSSGGECFFYPVELKCARGILKNGKDFRSPKTLNTDSSLLQQKIFIQKDNNGNLLELADIGNYFEEELIESKTKAGSYYASENLPITAYYVQPGTPKNIPLQVAYNKKDSSFRLTVGQLIDSYKNAVADGTNVSFCLFGAEEYRIINTATIGGLASTEFKTSMPSTVSCYAIINNHRSAIIKLKN